MWRVLALVGGVSLWSAAASAACPGDCNGSNVVSIDELVSAVRIALSQAPLSSCAAADSNDDGRVTVDDLVRAVNAALRGCPATPSPTNAPTLEITPTPITTATATATASASASASATRGTDTPRPTSSPSRISTASITMTPTASPPSDGTATPSTTEIPTATATLEAATTTTPTVTASTTLTPDGDATATPTIRPTSVVTATATSEPTRTQSPTRTVTNVPSATLTGTPSQPATQSPTRSPSSSSTLTRTPTPSSTPTRTAPPSSTPIPTQTRTATATASPSSTPTGGPLGTRHFSLDPATSAFVSVLAGQQVSVTGFTGYLDLQAGAVNPQTGRAIINVTGSSTYLQLVSAAGLICIKPLVPVAAAGIVDCNGGTNLGTVVRQDHHIGKVGDNSFTAQACTDAGGTVEPDNFPHPKVCNGPLTVEPSAVSDSGSGAVAIGPDPTFSINGLPAELTFEQGPQCTGQGDGFSAVFVLVSSNSRTEILHESDGNNTLVYDDPGENFSCPAWTQENGPGKLILSFPTLHGAVGNADVINAFVFDD